MFICYCRFLISTQSADAYMPPNNNAANSNWLTATLACVLFQFVLYAFVEVTDSSLSTSSCIYSVAPSHVKFYLDLLLDINCT